MPLADPRSPRPLAAPLPPTSIAQPGAPMPIADRAAPHVVADRQRPSPLATRRPARPVPLVVGAVVALLIAACGSTNPSPSPTSASAPTTDAPTSQPSASPAGSAPARSPAGSSEPSANPNPSSASASASADPVTDAIYDTIEQQVIAIRGLKPTRPVERQFIDEAELRTLMTEQFDTDTPPAYVAANERLYKALGLIPKDSNLRTLILDLLSGGVAGFYRNDIGKLFVVSKTGTPGPAERFYFAHEYDHALQDQNSTIFKDQHGVLDEGDRLLARQALYEGDASLVMTQWASANLNQTELLDLLASGNDPAGQALLARTPAILRDTLTFPYTTGLGYVSAVQAAGGWPAVDAYFKAMPETTEQILHPQKYTAGEHPVDATIPADLASKLGSGWTVPLQDTLGEFQLGIWLREGGVAGTSSGTAAAGWGGDRVAVAEGPGGSWAVALQTVWDSADDASEFEAAAKTALKKSTGEAQILPGAGGKTRWIVVGSDADSLAKAANALGLAG